MIEFQTDVPMPEPSAKPGRPPKYPFSTMPVGASFFVAGKTQSGVSAAATISAKRSGRKFATRGVTEGGVKGVRVWRIA